MRRDKKQFLPESSTSESQPESQPADSESEDMDLMQRRLRHLSPKESLDGISLLQSSVILTSVPFVSASFTDEFMDLVWPMTVRGERNLTAAADVDADTLRHQWQETYNRYSIPRPVGVSNFFLHRPPSAHTWSRELQLTIARFDNPLTIHLDIERHWSTCQHPRGDSTPVTVQQPCQGPGKEWVVLISLCWTVVRSRRPILFRGLWN